MFQKLQPQPQPQPQPQSQPQKLQQQQQQQPFTVSKAQTHVPPPEKKKTKRGRRKQTAAVSAPDGSKSDVLTNINSSATSASTNASTGNEEEKKNLKDRSHITSYWSVQESTMFPVLLEKFGSDWESIAKQIGSKSATMVRNYFQRGLSENSKWETILKASDLRIANAKFREQATFNSSVPTFVTMKSENPQGGVYDQRVQGQQQKQYKKQQQQQQQQQESQNQRQSSSASAVSGYQPQPQQQQPQSQQQKQQPQTQQQNASVTTRPLTGGPPLGYFHTRNSSSYSSSYGSPSLQHAHPLNVHSSSQSPPQALASVKPQQQQQSQQYQQPSQQPPLPSLYPIPTHTHHSSVVPIHSLTNPTPDIRRDSVSSTTSSLPPTTQVAQPPQLGSSNVYRPSASSSSVSPNIGYNSSLYSPNPPVIASPSIPTINSNNNNNSSNSRGHSGMMKMSALLNNPAPAPSPSVNSVPSTSPMSAQPTYQRQPQPQLPPISFSNTASDSGTVSSPSTAPYTPKPFSSIRSLLNDDGPSSSSRITPALAPVPHIQQQSSFDNRVTQQAPSSTYHASPLSQLMNPAPALTPVSQSGPPTVTQQSHPQPPNLGGAGPLRSIFGISGQQQQQQQQAPYTQVKQMGQAYGYSQHPSSQQQQKQVGQHGGMSALDALAQIAFERK
ncbi:unnamed protein product [Ambrosiozyma monospora]|uniref:Unnamed protein product n=1 Tax=Ambrosiozyma monospora TaxID=43982 RepID=A0ACB5T1J5_AMBMO|nr:unnamed protein product [Ambrosiozyma monospora]